MVSLFIEIFWDEAISEYYWRVLNVILKNSPISIISPISYVSNLTAWKMSIRTDHQRRLFKVKKPVELPI
jgi:hypothetical protein